MRDTFVLCELWLHAFIKVDESALIAHGIAIIWRGEYSDGLAAMLHQISLVLDLMGTHKQGQIIMPQEGFGNVRTKGISHSTL